MVLYRIAKEHYIQDLSGDGARLYGGRWNKKGTSVVYASETRALAALEFLVHLPVAAMPADLSIAAIEIKEKIKPLQIDMKPLPRNWRDFPAPEELAHAGSQWASQKSSLLLRVPSVLVDDEYNVLINPLHPHIKHLQIQEIGRYSFDPRLLK